MLNKVPPISMIVLILVILASVLYYLTRIIVVIVEWNALSNIFPHWFLMFFLLMYGCVYVITYLPITIGLWRGDLWAWKSLWLASILSMILDWGMKSFIVDLGQLSFRLQFKIVSQVIILFCGAIVLLKPENRKYYNV